MPYSRTSQGLAISEDSFNYFSVAISYLYEYLNTHNLFNCLHRHIEEVDLLRFLTKEEVDLVIPLFEGAPETGKIKKSALKNWVVMLILNECIYHIHFLLISEFI